MNYDHLTTLDYIVLGIMVLSCIFAFFRGLVREILSLIAWIGAGLITLYYFPTVAEHMRHQFRSPIVAATVATVTIYAGALAAFMLLNMLIIKSIRRGEEGGTLDNLLGLLFGAARGALIVSLGYLLLMVALPEKETPEWISQSVTKPYLEKGANLLAAAAPEYMQELSSLEKKAAEDVQSVRRQPTPEGTGTNEENGSGYSHRNTEQLDRLIQSTGEPAR